MLTSSFLIQKAIAVASSSPEPTSIFIYSLSINNENSGSEMLQWTIIHRLTGCHNRPITHLDWSDKNIVSQTHACNDQKSAPTTIEGTDDRTINGRIISCGEDCRVFIWSYNTMCQEWTASLCILQQQTICFTPLYCEWDPTGERFAIAMGGNQRTSSLEICQLNQDGSGEWTAFQAGRREIGSSLLCLDWHPCCHIEMQLVACGGCDSHCRIFSASSGNVDLKSDGYNPIKDKIPFNKILR